MAESAVTTIEPDKVTWMETRPDEGCSQADYLRVRNTLVQILEEIKLRRTSDVENEERIKCLVGEKHQLECKYDAAMSRGTTLQQKHLEEVRQIHRQYADKEREIQEEKSRQKLISESVEKETHALKDEVRSLQLQKYSLEKQLHEQSGKLQLQMSTAEKYLSQLSALEQKFNGVAKQYQLVVVSQGRLEKNVAESLRLSRTLTYENQHQRCLVDQYARSLDATKQSLLEARVKIESQPAETSHFQRELECRVKILEDKVKEKDENLESRNKDLKTLENHHETTVKQLQDSHKLLEGHLAVAKQYREECQVLTAEVDSLQAEQGRMKAEGEDRIQGLMQERDRLQQAAKESKAKEEAVKAGLSRLETELKEVRVCKNKLEELNTSWADENLKLTEDINRLQAIVNVEKADGWSQVELSVTSSQMQTDAPELTTTETQVPVTSTSTSFSQTPVTLTCLKGSQTDKAPSSSSCTQDNLCCNKPGTDRSTPVGNPEVIYSDTIDTHIGKSEKDKTKESVTLTNLENKQAEKTSKVQNESKTFAGASSAQSTAKESVSLSKHSSASSNLFVQKVVKSPKTLSSLSSFLSSNAATINAACGAVSPSKQAKVDKDTPARVNMGVPSQHLTSFSQVANVPNTKLTLLSSQKETLGNKNKLTIDSSKPIAEEVRDINSSVGGSIHDNMSKVSDRVLQKASPNFTKQSSAIVPSPVATSKSTGTARVLGGKGMHTSAYDPRSSSIAITTPLSSNTAINPPKRANVPCSPTSPSTNKRPFNSLEKLSCPLSFDASNNRKEPKTITGHSKSGSLNVSVNKPEECSLTTDSLTSRINAKESPRNSASPKNFVRSHIVKDTFNSPKNIVRLPNTGKSPNMNVGRKILQSPGSPKTATVSKTIPSLLFTNSTSQDIPAIDTRVADMSTNNSSAVANSAKHSPRTGYNIPKIRPPASEEKCVGSPKPPRTYQLITSASSPRPWISSPKSCQRTVSFSDQGQRSSRFTDEKDVAHRFKDSPSQNNAAAPKGILKDASNSDKRHEKSVRFGVVHARNPSKPAQVDGDAVLFSDNEDDQIEVGNQINSIQAILSPDTVCTGRKRKRSQT